MATITGKRFQMTDGAASPINLFPYTVSEAVYGLNNAISNAISSALSTISLSTYAGTSAIGSSTQPVYYNGSALVACDLSTTYAPYNAAGYLPLTGGTISNNGTYLLVLNSNDSGANAAIGMQLSINAALKGLLLYSSDWGTALMNTIAGYWAIGVLDNGTPYYGTASTKYTIWHSGNDGAGSGLDADLLDGIDSTGFFRRYILPNEGQSYDANNYTQEDTHYYTYGDKANVQAWSNLPGIAGSGPFGLLNLKEGGYPIQLFHNYSEKDIWFRNMYYDSGVVWSDWKVIYNSGNSNLSTVDWTCNALTTYSSINARGKAALYHWYNDSLKMYIGYSAPDDFVHLYTPGINIILNTSANVGIGTTSPTQKLHVAGAVYASSGYRTTHDFGLYKGSDITSGLTANDGALYYSGHFLAVWAYSFKVYANIDVTGNILSTGDQVISSDLTLKTNLQDVTYSVSDIAKCRAVTFDWKDGHGHSAGSIAQDWKPLIPELVHGEEGGMTLAYGQIALVNSILEAREIERLKERVAELENQLKMRS